MSAEEKFVSGFVSILGRPNAGKSTLLNALVRTKVAIVADKPQTTRTSIQGALTLPNAQILFLDTPGIHKPDSAINKRMMEFVRTALHDRDLLLYLADATRRFGREDREALALLRRVDTPKLLVLTKIDLVDDKRELLPVIDSYREQFEFADYLPISATKGVGLDDLKQAIVSRLPEGPAYFPPDFVTDQPERFLAAELVREKVLRETREEVPHSVTVLVDQWQDSPDLLKIFATIYVEREGQKKIIVGSKGSMLKRIGTQARKEMESIFGQKIYLNLFVKVQPRWRERPAFLDSLDWRKMAGADDS